MSNFMTLDKGSLVLINYTAKIKDTNKIFETTLEEEAKKSELYDPTRKYVPKLVSVGEGWVLKGLDEALEKANSGDKFDVVITPDKAFGERNPSKVRMIALRKLGDRADDVKIGDEIEMNQRTGIIRFVGSGRVQIDFNHRLAGRTLAYQVEIIKKLQESGEKVLSLIKRRIPVDDDKIKFFLDGSNLTIELPEESFLVEGLQVIKRGAANDIFKYVDGISTVKFVESYAATEMVQASKDAGKHEEVQKTEILSNNPEK
jgi:peptidylprolyl isomerase